jgi:hypothetical protein
MGLERLRTLELKGRNRNAPPASMKKKEAMIAAIRSLRIISDPIFTDTSSPGVWTL